MSFEMLIGGQRSIATGIRTGNSFRRHMGLFMCCKMTALHIVLIALVALEWTLRSDSQFRVEYLSSVSVEMLLQTAGFGIRLVAAFVGARVIFGIRFPSFWHGCNLVFKLKHF